MMRWIPNQCDWPNLRPSSSDMRRRWLARGSSVRYTRCPKAMMRSLRARRSRTQDSPRREGLLAGAQALEGAEHGRQLGDEPHRLAVLGRPAVVAAVGVYEDCGADGGAQHVHRVRPGRRVLDDAQHHAIELL